MWVILKKIMKDESGCLEWHVMSLVFSGMALIISLLAYARTVDKK